MSKARDIVIQAGKELVARGLIARTWGNVSQRVNPNTMVITPSGRDYLSLTRDDIVAVSIDALEYEGEVKPSSEKGAHASCYAQKNVNFVIHTHQLYASIVSACGIDFFETGSRYPLLGAKVLCTPYGLPSTKKLSKNIQNALAQAQGNCIIMKNHGALCYGKDFEETFEAANQLENACRDYLEQKFMESANTDSFSEEAQARFVLQKFGADAGTLEPRALLSNLEGANVLVNNSIEAVALSLLGKPLLPLVDDFAQIVGTGMRTVRDDQSEILRALKKAGAVFVAGCGAVCTGPTMDDARAVSMIVEKNCKAFLGAALHGRVQSINALESKLMRTIYKMKYSKQINQ